MLKRKLAGMLITLVAASACAPRVQMSHTPRPVQSATPDTGGADAWRQVARHLAPGSGVRLLLEDGTRMRAVLLAADDTSVLVKPRTRVPEPERRIAYSELELLEADRGGIGPGKAAAIGIGAGAGAFFTLLMITFAIVSD